MSVSNKTVDGTQGTLYADWATAWLLYIVAYSVGTIVLELAEPTQGALAYPAFGLALVVWAAQRFGRVPTTMSNAAGTWGAIVVAAIVIALTR